MTGDTVARKMLVLRSIAFNLYFYVNITLWLIVASPLLLLPGAVLWRVVASWSRLNLVMLKWLAGIDVELRGLEHLPDTPVIVASKHQSAWETVSLLHLFRRPAFVLKRELMWVPLFGWYAAHTGMIPVNRGKGLPVLRAMVAAARQVAADGRQIVIYPEGTRRAPGAQPAYKQGVAYLYRELGLPVVPIALNSGLYWPRRGFLRHPGTIVVEFLPAIEPGLEPQQFFQQLQDKIETATDRLLAEAARSVAPPPLSSEIRDRIAAITKT